MRGQKLGAGLIAQSQSALPPFILHRPTSLGEAVALTRQHPEAVIAAGCSDLVAQFREGLEPEVLISVQRIKELRAISNNAGVLSIGSSVSHAEGSRSPDILSTVPALAAAWGSIATVRIRYRGTLGGNLLSRRYRYEMPVILSALGGQMQFHGGDITTLPVSSLWDRTLGNVGILTAVTVDTASLLWFGYERSMRPLSTVSLAVRKNAVAGLTVSAVCGSEYRRPFVLSHASEATDITELDPVAVGEVVAAQLPDEAGDYTGSIDYRRHLVGVLCRSLLAEATGNQRKG
ncbi:FAD binding domain-containing protein [Paenarthrobacter aurescens]|jgi:carbon-monoxide dehydrogenase medium subunit|uniref:Dehydrogenase protein n=1 Tax=Paenarthrobacter aurescens (strain TC1) TaxID=290340 RepID=A1R604_PAEAT|nr:FAD binding domain-containing protein [Paenarthrobacter aurescens]ABM08060.1 putative dehydrogenase protein [Paenarthrobacter aurescens TC1]